MLYTISYSLLNRSRHYKLECLILECLILTAMNITLSYLATGPLHSNFPVDFRP